MLDDFVRWFVGIDNVILLGRYLLIALVWFLGIRLNKKKGSPVTWGITWLWGLICIALTIIVMCRCDYIGLGFASFVTVLFSLFAITIYLSMMGATIFYTFFKPKTQ